MKNSLKAFSETNFLREGGANVVREPTYGKVHSEFSHLTFLLFCYKSKKYTTKKTNISACKEKRKFWSNKKQILL